MNSSKKRTKPSAGAGNKQASSKTSKAKKKTPAPKKGGY